MARSPSPPGCAGRPAFRPGDTILFRVTGEGRGEFVVIPTHADLDALWARYRGPGAFEPEYAWAEVAEAIARDVLVPGEPGGGGA